MVTKPLLIAVLGATATGKSQLSHQLALKLNAEIISMDSAQVYIGMDIGTAKPTLAQQKQVPYHLINRVNSWENYNTGRYVHDCLNTIQEIHARQKHIVLTGGTMLYYRSLTQGIADLPNADFKLRQQLQAQWQQDPKPLIQQLTQLDPITGTQLHPNDKQRILRALEIVLLSKKTLAQAQQKTYPSLVPDITIMLRVDNRQALHQKIAQRWQKMLKQGILDEVKQLYDHARTHAELPAMQSVGYRQLWQYYNSYLDYQQACADVLTATRRLAKRQITWLNAIAKQTPFDLSINFQQTNVHEKALQIIQSGLNR